VDTTLTVAFRSVASVMTSSCGGNARRRPETPLMACGQSMAEVPPALMLSCKCAHVGLPVSRYSYDSSGDLLPQPRRGRQGRPLGSLKAAVVADLD